MSLNLEVPTCIYNIYSKYTSNFVYMNILYTVYNKKLYLKFNYISMIIKVYMHNIYTEAFLADSGGCPQKKFFPIFRSPEDFREKFFFY